MLMVTPLGLAPGTCAAAGHAGHSQHHRPDTAAALAGQAAVDAWQRVATGMVEAGVHPWTSLQSGATVPVGSSSMTSSVPEDRRLVASAATQGYRSHSGRARCPISYQACRAWLK